MNEKYFTREDLLEFSQKADLHALALAFAEYLAGYRARHTGIIRPCVISTDRPEVKPGYVRLPHLVALVEEGLVQDKVMWEVLPRAIAMRWLGATLPDQMLIENQLPQLLELRQLARERRLPNDPRYRELVQLVSKGRYISILFVYQHIDLFGKLFRSL